MNTTSRILITGAAGLSGKWLNSLLLEKGFQNISLTDRDKYKECDITKKDAVNKLIAEIKPEYVFHLAGLLPDKKYTPEDYYKVNYLGTKNLLDALLENKLFGTRVLITSSSGVYGDEGQIAIAESTPKRPFTEYAKSKAAQEDLGLEYFSAHKIQVVIARAVNNFVVGSKLFLPELAKRIVEGEKNGQTIKERSLEGYRDYLDTRDVVSAYYLLLLKGQPGEVYNVSSGKAYYHKELFEFMAGQAKINYEIEPEENSNYLKYQVLANAKLIKDTGWQPKYDIKDTLLEIMNYWRTKL